MPDTKQTYGTEEIADALDLHPNSVRRKLQNDEIRGRKIGNRWVVPHTALRDWLGDELFEIHFADGVQA